MAHYRACVTWRSFKSTYPDQAGCVRKLTGKITMNIAMMCAHTAGHDVACHIIYTSLIIYSFLMARETHHKSRNIYQKTNVLKLWDVFFKTHSCLSKLMIFTLMWIRIILNNLIRKVWKQCYLHTIRVPLKNLKKNDFLLHFPSKGPSNFCQNISSQMMGPQVYVTNNANVDNHLILQFLINNHCCLCVNHFQLKYWFWVWETSERSRSWLDSRWYHRNEKRK